MALINCPECGKQVSDKAYSCPECGFPIKDYMESKSEENKEKSNEYIAEENIEESDSENKVFSDLELDMLYESENGKRIQMIKKVSCDLDYNSAKKVVDEYFKRKFPEKELNLNVKEKSNNETDFDNIIVEESELDSLYKFTNGNKTLIVQKVARNYNTDYSVARKIVDDYFEKRFPEKQRKNNVNQKKKRFNWKLIFLVIVCIIYPFIGAILLWVFKMPNKKLKRFLLTLLLIFYSFIKIVSNSEVEPQSEKTVNDTEIVEEVKEDEVEENTIEDKTVEIEDEKSNVEDVEKSDDDIFLEKSNEYLGTDQSNMLLMILKDKIGFEKIVFVEKLGETFNYKITADGYEIVATDLEDDFRIFIPNSSYVFYEDSKVVMTNENFKDKIVTSDEANIYYIMAQEIITSCLKNPKSADFPSIIFSPDDIGFKKNGNLVLVQSYVDATNSFGATIRSKWEVQFVVLDMDTYSYDLKYINFDGEKAGNYIDMD